MSKFGSSYASATAAKKEEQSSVLFTFVPRPGSDADVTQAQDRADVICSLHKRVRDLNDPNHMTKTVEEGMYRYIFNYILQILLCMYTHHICLLN